MFTQNDISKLLEQICASGGVATRTHGRIQKVKKKLEKEVMSMEEILTYFPKKIEKQNSILKKPKNAWQLFLGETVASAAEKWKNASDEEKKPYVKRAQELYQEYLREKNLLEEKQNDLFHEMTDAEEVLDSPPTPKKVKNDDLLIAENPKKRRGRPPKNKGTEKEKILPKEIKKIQITKNKSEDKDTVLETKPKKRGRPSKKEIEARELLKEKELSTKKIEDKNHLLKKQDSIESLKKIFEQIEIYRMLEKEKLLEKKVEITNLMTHENQIVRIIGIELLSKME